MEKCILQIFFERDNEERQRAPHFSIVEVPLPSFEACVRSIRADRLITGQVLFSSSDDEDPTGRRRIVWQRQPIAFRGSAVARFNVPVSSYVDGGNVRVLEAAHA